MVQRLARYVARSPRYILQTDDNTLIRIAGPQQIPWEEGTELHNVSLSGLAFTAPSDLAPLIGETIKIQFDAPEHGEMACFALVIRLQRLRSATMLVAVKFLNLEMAQRVILAQSLAGKMRSQAEAKLGLVQTPKWWMKKKWQFVMGLLMSAAWLGFVHWLWF